MRINDPVAVARQYATETNLEARRRFVASLDAEKPLELPPYDLPLRSRRASSVFVATKG